MVKSVKGLSEELDELKVDIFKFLRKLKDDNLLTPNPYSHNQVFEPNTLAAFLGFYTRLFNDVGKHVERKEKQIRGARIVAIEKAEKEKEGEEKKDAQ